MTSHSPASSPELPDRVQLNRGIEHSGIAIVGYTADQMNAHYLNGYDVVYRDSVIEMIDRRRHRARAALAQHQAPQQGEPK